LARRGLAGRFTSRVFEDWGSVLRMWGLDITCWRGNLLKRLSLRLLGYWESEEVRYL
jgi:hypothetical protein